MPGEPANGRGKFIEALIAARQKFKPLVKNHVNPYFKSKYADLADLHDAVDEALAKNGFAVMQPLAFDEKGTLLIRTRLEHTGGHMEESLFPLPGGVEPQKLAAAVTYGRRISLSSLLGIPADDDDDGEATRQEGKPKAEEKPAPPPKKEPEAKKGHGWEGTITEVNPAKPGVWKVAAKGKDGQDETFAIVNADHAVVAQTARDQKVPVIAFYHLNANKTKIIDGIEPKEVKR